MCSLSSYLKQHFSYIDWAKERMMYVVAKLLMHWQVNFNSLKASSNFHYARISRFSVCRAGNTPSRLWTPQLILYREINFCLFREKYKTHKGTLRVERKIFKRLTMLYQLLRLYCVARMVCWSEKRLQMAVSSFISHKHSNLTQALK